MASYLPEAPGLLPKWLLFVSVVSIANSAQAYMTLHYTQRVYEAQPQSVTSLSARTFGTWTFLSSVIRLYAAYNISNPQIYQLALATYAIALCHFASEWLIFGTARWGKGLGAPLVVASSSIVWMLTQWNFYVV